MSEEIFGSSGSGSSSGTSQSGFSLLSPQIQSAFNQYAGQVNGATANPSALTSAFTPQALNSGAQSSLTNLSNNAYAPTAANVQSSLALQQNPYNQQVIDTINQQATGQNSAVNEATSAAGQFGSNRATLGANNVDLSRLQQIGDFEQGNYTTAMNNALTTIPQDYLTSAGASINAGLTQQQQALAQSTAPYTALSAYGQLLGAIPQSGGSTSTQGSSNSTGSGFGMF